MSQPLDQHAVVIGASLAGLLAARVLADHYEQVTVLERDQFPAPGEQRKGVPQGRHVHGLLGQGRAVLEGLFPGLTQELVDQGALTGDITEEGLWFNGGAYHCRFRSGLMGLAVSRPRLEACIRARVLARPNVRAIEGCDVLGLVARDDQSGVAGVRLIRRLAGSAEELLRADLVVDASGRGSRTPAWLEALGYPRPEEERVEVQVAYTSRLYRRRPEQRGFVNVAAPETKRVAALLPQEGDRWIVTLAGYMGESAPTDDHGFLEFARTLPVPEIYAVLRQAEPLSEPVTMTYPANRRRHYEQLARFPDGLLVFGDALASFTPTYGQGMTVAAMEAVALQACLAQGRDRLAQRFFQRANQVIDVAWSIAVGNDLRIPGVKGRPTRAQHFIHWYLDKLHMAARHDPAVALAFQKVANLLAPPASLLRPAVALRVLRGNLRRPRPATPAVVFPVPLLPDQSG